MNEQRENLARELQEFKDLKAQFKKD